MALNRGKDKNGQDRGADFINLVAFGSTADLLDKYGVKGRRFAFECHVNTGSYEKDGQRIYTTDFVIDRVEFISAQTEAKKEEATPTYSDSFMDIPDNIAEELPFN